MKDIDKLIHGTEIDLEGLEGRADQAQIQKVCEFNKLLILCWLPLASDTSLNVLILSTTKFLDWN